MIVEIILVIIMGILAVVVIAWALFLSIGGSVMKIGTDTKEKNPFLKRVSK